MGRRSFLRTLAGGLLTAPLAAEAQQTGNLPRVGYLSNSARYDEPDTAFFAGLREHGYEPDRNILVEARYSAGRPDRNREFAADLVRLRCRVIVAWGPPVVAEIMGLTASIPIIAISSTDFVVLGWAATFARPGGNITGFMLDAGELNAKRFELLKEVVPMLATVALLQNPTRPGSEADLAEATRAARTLKLKTELFTVSAPEQFERAFAQMVRHRVDGLLVLDRILKGERPADLPIQRPVKLELAVNLKAAKTIGLVLPPSLLQRADQVIE
jgi:putative ABC transport system substrate-binding protein